MAKQKPQKVLVETPNNEGGYSDTAPESVSSQKKDGTSAVVQASNPLEELKKDMAEPFCANCRFRREDRCARNAPKPMEVGGTFPARWPIIRLTDWCGDHQPVNTP